MHAELAAGIEQTIDDQQPQYLFPTHRFPAWWHTLAPELIQAQLLPQLASQPAVAEHAWPPQLQTAQANLYAVHRIGGKLAVVRKQTHRGEALFRLVEYLQRLPPRRLLLIVDLAEIQHRALRRFAAGQPSVLNDAEVAMVLTVFLAIRAAQKHASAAECQRSRGQKRGKVFTQAFSRKRALTALPILLRPAGKLTSSAKVRLATVRNLCFLPKWISSKPSCRSPGFRRPRTVKSSSG